MKAVQNQYREKFTLKYTFKHPQKDVFNAFTTPEALKQWWGPAESENTVISLEFSPGGVFHFRMNFQGEIMYGRFLYKKIESHNYLEFTNAFADEHANVISAPFDKNFPLEILYRLEFIEKEKGKTTISLTAEPLDATQRESDVFNSLIPSMNEGFAKTWDKLQGYLEKSL